ncbi:hypothetical protein NC651_000047 [Populus alba x Populus x berolinensis]|nr:hypothetical protein NC651_000047 [Populus alba x Populus x berolinensis]
MGINAVGSRRKLLLLRDSRSLERGITCVRRSWICSGFSNKLPPCYALVGVHCYLLGVVDSLDAWHMDTKARRFIGMLADHGA